MAKVICKVPSYTLTFYDNKRELRNLVMLSAATIEKLSFDSIHSNSRKNSQQLILIEMHCPPNGLNQQPPT